MNSIKKIALVGGVLLTSSAFLVSFTGDNDGKDKKKKYQIIHVSNGETITHDTIVDMSSSYTPEQFVADMGITSDNIEIVKIPSIPNMDGLHKEMKTIVHTMEDMEFEMEKAGEEIEKVIEMKIDSKHHGDIDEEVEISVEIDEDGNKTITKKVNGEEVEVTEEELNDFHIMELEDGGDIEFILENVIDEELTEKLENLEVELETIMEELEESGENVKVMSKCIKIDSDGENDFEWESKDGEHEIKVISMGGDSEDHTIVLVTEDYNESSDSNISIQNSTKELDVYPNPNDGTFKIRYQSDDKKKTSITVTDASGKQVFKEDLGKFSGSYEKEINLKEFGSGMYTVTIENGNNKEVQKVMIK